MKVFRNSFYFCFSLLLVSCLLFLECAGKKEKKEDVVSEDVQDVKVTEIEKEEGKDIKIEDKKEIKKEIPVFPDVIEIVEDKVEDVQLKDLSCREIGFLIVECLKGPGDIDCVQFYKEKGTEEAKEKFDKFYTCFNEKKCTDLYEGEYFSKCIEENCNDERLSCFSGDKKCFDIYKCRKGCEANDPLCPVQCMSEGTKEAQELWLKYSQCIFDAAKKEGDKCSFLPNGWPSETCEKYIDKNYCGQYVQKCTPI